MLVSPNSSVIRMAYELGITGVILPKFDKMMETTQETPHHIYSMGEHAILSMEQVRADKVLKLTMLLHDVAKPKMKTIDENSRAHFKRHDVEGER